MTRVAIIGAGTAGLSCCRKLLELLDEPDSSEIDKIVIYEARDRFGGRIHSASLDPSATAVDLGPNWLHGDSSANSAQRFYHAPEVTLHDVGDRNVIIAPDGRVLGPREQVEVEGYMWEYVDRAIAYSAAHCAEIPASASLVDFVKQELEREEGESEDKERMEKKRERVLSAIEMFGFYIGEAAARQSLKYACLEEMAPGDTMYVASGYGGILRAMAEPVLAAAAAANKKVEVRLCAPVVAVESEIEKQKSKVVTRDGGQEWFEKVVVAVPLGVLKAEGIRFAPELPAEVRRAVRDVGYGRLEKVYMKFSRAFWGTNDQFEFLSPRYAQDTNDQHWPMTAISLAQLPGRHGQAALLWYTYGEISERVVRELESSKSDDEAIAAATAFFAPYYSRIPGFDAAVDERPEKVVWTRWSEDEYAGYGSYTNAMVGLEEGREKLGVLRTGMGGRGVYFAGEHCADELQIGTVGGAVMAGEQAAERCLSGRGGD
ncbi:hypothetical protein BZA70DRAFT_290676 [Myxozyma melibiosi]|uniref:Amine oxidase domain-containing protein n=1 Tax=Myxozyma melibiosi TaxID=54550 RepID=A0ABR1F2Q1_9ASCO